MNRPAILIFDQVRQKYLASLHAFVAGALALASLAMIAAVTMGVVG